MAEVYEEEFDFEGARYRLSGTVLYKWDGKKWVVLNIYTVRPNLKPGELIS